MAKELFRLNKNRAICCNPGGQFHGWLFRLNKRGLWVSLKKLAMAEIPDPPDQAGMLDGGRNGPR
jgi:hypothetical protein